MAHDIENRSLVWLKNEKKFGFVVGSVPFTESYNKQADVFLIRTDSEYANNELKIKRNDFKLITVGTYILVNKNMQDTTVKIPYLLIDNKHVGGFWIKRPDESKTKIEVERLIKPLSKNTRIDLLPVGAHVSFVNKELNTSGVVLYASNDGVRIATYPSLEYKNISKTGVTQDNIITVASRELKLLKTPAPRILRSDMQRLELKTKFKRQINSKNITKYWRVANYMPYSMTYNAIQAYKRKAKIDGITLATAINEMAENDTETAEINTNTIITILNDNKTNLTDKAAELKDYLINAEIVHCCDECNDLSEDLTYSQDEQTSFCNNCSDEFCFSDLMNDYIRDCNALPVYDSVRRLNRGEADDWVTSNYGSNELYWNSNRDGFITYDVYSELNDNDNDDDDDDEDNSDDGSYNGLRGYHSTRRNWIEKWQDKRYVPLGVELEVYCEERRTVVEALRSTFAPNDLYLEHDGSLDSECGFEAISQPLGKTEWDSFGKQLLKVLRDNEAVAYNSPAGHGYGIHININRQYLTSLQETRMFMFLAAAENSNFVKAMAQRSKLYGNDLSIGGLTKSNQKISDAGGFTSYYKGDDSSGNSLYRKTIEGRGKYAPIKLHDRRCEIRIFQSTLNSTSFYKNLEFVWALVEWTNTKSATGSSWLHTDFLKWLAARPHSEVDYPNFTAYLRKVSYTVVGGDTYENTWLHLTRPPTRKSIALAVVAKIDDESIDDNAVDVPPAYVARTPILVDWCPLAA